MMKTTMTLAFLLVVSHAQCTLARYLGGVSNMVKGIVQQKYNLCSDCKACQADSNGICHSSQLGPYSKKFKKKARKIKPRRQKLK